MARWEDLPSDLLASISKLLHSSYATCVRLRAVSKSWRRCLNGMERTGPQIPWLMLPYQDYSSSTLRGFYCPVDKTVYHLDLPGPAKPTLCKGSFAGWSFNVEEGSGLHLFNPLSNLLIHLPPLSTFPNVIDYDPNRLDEEYYILNEFHTPQLFYYYDKLHIQWIYIYKLCASSPASIVVNSYTTTTTPPPCVFVAIYGECRRLAFCSVGDASWKPVSTVKEHSSFEDVVFYDGKFYAGRCRLILECDLRSLQQPQAIPVEFPFKPRPVNTSIYLATSREEGLMMIVRYYKGEGAFVEGYGRVYSYRTTKFEVFKLVLVDGGGGGRKFECCKVTSLGERALFLGNNSPVFVATAGVEGIQANHIYYTDDNWEHHRRGFYGGHDVGVFSLEDESVRGLEGYEGNPLVVWPPPTWLLPNPS